MPPPKNASCGNSSPAATTTKEIREQLQRERTRVLERLLPARFALAGEAQVFPVAVEVRLPERSPVSRGPALSAIPAKPECGHRIATIQTLGR